MKLAVFSSQSYDQSSITEANKHFNHEITYFNQPLNKNTVDAAKGFDGVCVFVNDVVDSDTISNLKAQNIKFIALRCAGFNNVDLDAAKECSITVARVPAYSPYAVAEYTVGLLLAVNRKINRAWMRVRMDNFSLEGLVGRDLHGKVVGIVGTGRIGALVAKAFKLGFGCKVLASDVKKNPEIEKMDIPYVKFEELLQESDIVCLHCPMTEDTRHLVNMETIKLFKKGATLINTSRGGLTDPKALVEAIEKGYLGALGMDVYEDEKDLFFRNLSNFIVKDKVFQVLTAFPNVLCTGHQAFFTSEALNAIANTTLQNATDFEAGKLNEKCSLV